MSLVQLRHNSHCTKQHISAPMHSSHIYSKATVREGPKNVLKLHNKFHSDVFSGHGEHVVNTCVSVLYSDTYKCVHVRQPCHQIHSLFPWFSGKKTELYKHLASTLSSLSPTPIPPHLSSSSNSEETNNSHDHNTDGCLGIRLAVKDVLFRFFCSSSSISHKGNGNRFLPL